MKKLSVSVLLIAVALPVFAGSKKVATINGIDIYRVRTAGGFFCPPTTTILAADPKQPGSLNVLNTAAAPSITQQVLQPAVQGAALCGASFLHRPDQTTVNQAGGGADVYSNNENEAVAVAGAEANAASSGNSHNNNNGNSHTGTKPAKHGKGGKK